MSWQDTSPEVYQAIKIQKSLLNRYSPNRSAVAELIGVRPSTVEGWCDPTKMNPNFPLALVSRHPAARELLDHHAYQIGFTLTPLQPQAPNGEVRDELMACVSDLGQVAERLQGALRDVRSPGRVDAEEAGQILRHAQALQQSVCQMIGELTAILGEELS